VWREKLIEILTYHRGKIIGVILGFILSLMVLFIGFLKTLFIVFCIWLGYIIGKKYDEREDIKEILNKILPPGYFK